MGPNQALVLALVLACPASAHAGLITTRSGLATLLGAGAIIESFQNLPVAADDQADPDNLTTLDSTTVATFSGATLGGPGLVVPGIQFVSTQQIAWNGDGYFGIPGTSLFSNSPDSTLEIEFFGATSAFGLDLFAFSGFGDTAQVQILAADQLTVIATITNIVLPDSADPVFFGYSSPEGIGAVIISQANNPWSPIVKDVEFAAPEMPTVLLFASALLVIGIGGIRRRA
jgi:hypothetical protein